MSGLVHNPDIPPNPIPPLSALAPVLSHSLRNPDTIMRIERTANRQFKKCWLTTDEYQALRRTTTAYRDELIIRLGGEVGLRSFEIPQITPQHPRREIINDDSYHFLRVPEGKDTTGNGGKPRDAYLPRSV